MSNQEIEEKIEEFKKEGFSIDMYNLDILWFDYNNNDDLDAFWEIWEFLKDEIEYESILDKMKEFEENGNPSDYIADVYIYYKKQEATSMLMSYIAQDKENCETMSDFESMEDDFKECGLELTEEMYDIYQASHSEFCFSKELVNE